MTTLGFYFASMTAEQANDVRRRLNEIAADLGYVAGAAPTKGKGNASALMVAIANGDVIVKTKTQLSAERIAAAMKGHLITDAAWIRAIREEWEAHARPLIADLGPRDMATQADLWTCALGPILQDKHGLYLTEDTRRAALRAIGGRHASEVLQDQDAALQD